jgi:BirA family biotin operon repressor/biotin-[acetyl-CoA-carboxylase] ligase
LRALEGLDLGPIRCFERIDSTNDEARRWAEAGAPDLALVIADEQTAGKGRQGRKWFTPPSAALAFSLVLRGGPAGRLGFGRNPAQLEPWLMRLTALGGLSVCQALREWYQVEAQIKWPNDVLLERRKTAGILAEAHWQGDQLQAAILGIGINLASESVPPEAELIYPATCVETALGRPVERLEVLREVLRRSLYWLDRLASADFLDAWDECLAFKGEWVDVWEGDLAAPALRQGKLLGLDKLGRLRLRDHAGEEFTLLTGELRLRPASG